MGRHSCLPISPWPTTNNCPMDCLNPHGREAWAMSSSSSRQRAPDPEALPWAASTGAGIAVPRDPRRAPTPARPSDWASAVCCTRDTRWRRLQRRPYAGLWSTGSIHRTASRQPCRVRQRSGGLCSPYRVAPSGRLCGVRVSDAAYAKDSNRQSPVRTEGGLGEKRMGTVVGTSNRPTAEGVLTSRGGEGAMMASNGTELDEKCGSAWNAGREIFAKKRSNTPAPCMRRLKTGSSHGASG